VDGRHLAPDFTEFGRSGRRFARDDIIATEIGAIDADLPVRDSTVRPSAVGAALVTYRTIEGRGSSNRSPVWRRTAAGWLLEFHHGSPAD
jgi:hypothetical protein